jgi:hypothetical protein
LRKKQPLPPKNKQTISILFFLATFRKNSQERELAHPGGGFGRMVRSP